MPRPCHKPLPYIEQFRPQKKLVLCPFDATVIPLTSKLFWLQEYRQIKLITTLHQDTKSTGHLITSPGQEHEINFGEDMVETLLENSIAVSVIL
jgi:putative transposase